MQEDYTCLCRKKLFKSICHHTDEKSGLTNSRLALIGHHFRTNVRKHGDDRRVYFILATSIFLADTTVLKRSCMCMKWQLLEYTIILAVERFSLALKQLCR